MGQDRTAARLIRYHRHRRWFAVALVLLGIALLGWATGELGEVGASVSEWLDPRGVHYAAEFHTMAPVAIYGSQIWWFRDYKSFEPVNMAMSLSALLIACIMLWFVLLRTRRCSMMSDRRYTWPEAICTAFPIMLLAEAAAIQAFWADNMYLGTDVPRQIMWGLDELFTGLPDTPIFWTVQRFALTVLSACAVVLYLRVWRSRSPLILSRLDMLERLLLAGAVLIATSLVMSSKYLGYGRYATFPEWMFWTTFGALAAQSWALGGITWLLYRRNITDALRGITHCLKCGYDLRGTLAAGRTACPECGFEAAKLLTAGSEGHGSEEAGSKEIDAG